MNTDNDTTITQWGKYIESCALRLGNSEDMADRIQGGWLALLEHKDQPMTNIAFKIRNGVALPEQFVATPFSHLSRVDDEGEETSIEEEIAAENSDPETIVEALHSILVEAADANLEEIVDREMGKAIEDGDTERAKTIAAAWTEYQATKHQPTAEPSCGFAFDPPKGESKGEWQVLAEDAAEEDEESSDGLCDLTISETVKNRRIGRPNVTWMMAPVYKKVDMVDVIMDWRYVTLENHEMPMHASEGVVETRPDIETWPVGCWKAMRDTWGTFDFFKTFYGVWEEIAPKTETEQAYTLRYFASHLLKRGKIVRKEQFYGVAINLLGLPQEWLDCEEQEEVVGEDVVDSGAGEFGHIANILYGFDWEGWNDEELPEMEWPNGHLSIESVGGKPWETKAYLSSFLNAAINGASWKDATAAGWDGWRAARLSRPAVRTYIRNEDSGEKLANAAANNVDKFTAATKALVVGLTEKGIKVNGKGNVVEFWDWEKAIPNASRVSVTARKEEALIAACRKLEGKAAIFGQALESAYKWRQEQLKKRQQQMDLVEA